MRCRIAIVFLSMLALNFVAYGLCAAYNSKAYHACMEKCIRKGTSLKKRCSEICQGSNTP